jgi:Tfp pilus assembly protein PilZ
VATRLVLPLADKNDWVKVFDPRGGGVFVATAQPPAVGTEVRVDLTIADGGPRVILKGSVLWRRDQGDDGKPVGCAVGLDVGDREKVNFLNGYVRGGLLNRRERRRLPLRLPVTYGGLNGPQKTFTRDINEEGAFIIAESPLPEETVLHFVIGIPDRTEPLELRGVVSHTVIVEDEDLPGMGVRFSVNEALEKQLTELIDRLEADFFTGKLPEDVIS